MIYALKKHQLLTMLFFILVVGSFLRFYKLDWGKGLFTHPDEYHIVASVNQLSFPAQMHPHFFSYGTVTIYLIYFTKEVINNLFSIFNFQFSIFNSFLIGRFYSALSSTLTIIIVYKICRSLMERRFSYLAALLVALTPGLIQQAHFATPESALTFFLFGALLFMIKFLKQNKILFLVLASVFLGFALGVKIISIVFLVPLLLAIILGSFLKNLAPRHSGLPRISNYHGDSGCAAAYQNDGEVKIEHFKGIFKFFRKFFNLIILTLASLFITIATFFLVAPYVFLDYPAFRSNLDYEGALAIGKIPVFYTRQFIDTIPIVFQIEKIFPYALGPILLIMGIAGFFLTILRLITIHLRGVTSGRTVWCIPSSHLGGGRLKRSESHDSFEVNALLVVTIAFLSLFISNAFLFAKWTRFIAPTFPFFAIFAAYLLEKLTNKIRILSYTLTIVLLLSTILWATAFFSIYANPDVRITASNWLISYAKQGSTFLVEGGNMIDLPLKGNFQRISIDFYPLEQDLLARERIADALYSSDYFLVQSRRVFMNHQRLPNLYPKTSGFYNALFNGKMGFEQIKEFNSYPKLSLPNLNVEFPDEKAEETWSVFDHPVIRVFKKEVQLTKEDYSRFFDI